MSIIEEASKSTALMILLGETDMDYIDKLLEDGDYVVYTDEEAKEAVEEDIKDSLWAFNPSFLSHYIDLEPRHIIHLQKLYEDCNDILLKLVGNDLEVLIEDAISTDGRGHFLASYDGKEHEIKIEDTYYYIYRLN